MNTSYPRRLRVKFPEHWHEIWKDKDADIIDEEEIRQFFKTYKISWDEEFTSTYNAPKSSPSIGMTPDDTNWSDHDHEHRLVAFPEELRTAAWGFTKAGKLKSPASRVPKAASAAASSTRVRRKKKVKKTYEVSDDEVEAEGMDTGTVQWIWRLMKRTSAMSP
jgi:hypothetical protein